MPWLAKGQKSDWPSVLSSTQVIFHNLYGKVLHTLENCCLACACSVRALDMQHPPTPHPHPHPHPTVQRYTVRGGTTVVCEYLLAFIWTALSLVEGFASDQLQSIMARGQILYSFIHEYNLITSRYQCAVSISFISRCQHCRLGPKKVLLLLWNPLKDRMIPAHQVHCKKHASFKS